MKSLLITLCLFVTTNCFSQIFVNKQELTDDKIFYIEVWAEFNKEKETFYGMVDFGQALNPNDEEGQSYHITGAKGTKINFNGTIELLNFMHRWGWKITTINTKGEVISYLMERIKED